jgi:hypothetical protein
VSLINRVFEVGGSRDYTRKWNYFPFAKHFIIINDVGNHSKALLELSSQLAIKKLEAQLSNRSHLVNGREKKSCQ